MTRFMIWMVRICRIGQDGTWTVSQAVDAVLLDSGLDITVTIPTIIGDRLINKEMYSAKHNTPSKH